MVRVLCFLKEGAYSFELGRVVACSRLPLGEEKCQSFEQGCLVRIKVHDLFLGVAGYWVPLGLPSDTGGACLC